ncbi:MAG: MFS transporter [Prevotella sp.]|nr:MFS transporter [Prevotella sp.]MCM1075607.1 MFS transporter [Ruminococcus sp.]
MKNQKKGLHYGFIIVACCCLMMGVNIGLTFSCAGIFYKPVSESIGVSTGKFGIYMSVMYVASSLMLPAAGRMLEKYSARLLFSISSAIMGLTFLAMAFFTDVWEFYAAGAVLGATLSFLLYLSFPTMVNRWFDAKVGLLIGVCSAASGIGGMIFNPIAGAIITAVGWRMAYGVFAAVILFVVTPVLYILLRDYPADKGLLPYGADVAEKADVGVDNKKTSAGKGIEYYKAIRMPVFYLLVLFAFLMMGVSTLNLFIPGYTESLEYSIESAAWAASASMAGVTLGKLVLGYINDRNCTAGVLVTTLGGAVGLLIMLLGHDGLWLILGGAFLFGWAYAGVTVQTAMLTRAVFGNRSYARIYSIISIALAAGGAVASGGWGLLADATGHRLIFIVGAGFLALCAAIGIFSLKNTSSDKA